MRPPLKWEHIIDSKMSSHLFHPDKGHCCFSHRNVYLGQKALAKSPSIPCDFVAITQLWHMGAVIFVYFTIKGTTWSLLTWFRKSASVMVSNVPGNYFEGSCPTLKLFLFLRPHKQSGRIAGLYLGNGKKVQNKQTEKAHFSALAFSCVRRERSGKEQANSGRMGFL